jgi:mannan endo-1,4-beta-mannosidase
MWYAPILASEGQGGNRERLTKELDQLKKLGVKNLRILVGADRGTKNAVTVSPVLQEAPGVLNDTLLRGLDYLMVELQKRDMLAVLYLNNAWDWSGGYGFYLREVGHGDSPFSGGEGYNAYVDYVKAFSTDKKAQILYLNFVKSIVTRTNTITGKPYAEDPAIMSWQLCNEPRPFSRDKAEQQGFYNWVVKTASCIKQWDKNHLVSLGSEGTIGCGPSEALYTRLHLTPHIDYLTLHIWPVNWRWATPDRLYNSLPMVYQKADEYIAEHMRIAKQTGKPMVIEEFGYSRDNTFRAPATPTRARDAFYSYIFSKVIESAQGDGCIAGCNFWGWSGAGRPTDVQWLPGHDYLIDPPHEPQGWYSVYDEDVTTIMKIREAAKQLKKK